jgi:hypothetical protein
MSSQKPSGLGKGHKASISGDPQDMGLNECSSMSNSTKLRGETSEMKQQPTHNKSSISSDRGKFTVR